METTIQFVNILLLRQLHKYVHYNYNIDGILRELDWQVDEEDS